ncbi:cadherin-like domain-containing protein, partial [Vibrio parahaemolyticus]|uniref:cadherin-like domain-containing protein n=1 Tax=Vibrio parahaemolyticus TaxID=670 RepID=UPI001E484647
LDTNNGPANGTVSVNPDGSVTYTPNDNYHGTDSFTYIVTSGGVSESAIVEVNVTPANDAQWRKMTSLRHKKTLQLLLMFCQTILMWMAIS